MRETPLPDRPIFLAGADRSGKTYLRYFLSAHPAAAFSRRANLWTRYDRRFGPLDRPANLRRCLHALAENKHVRAMEIDWARLQADFCSGEPTYARLFALIHRQYADRCGKPRWGDQTEGIEHAASRIFSVLPAACVLHLIRDPRDHYQAVQEKQRRSAGAERQPRLHALRAGGLGATTARWLASAAAAEANQRRYPGRYLVVRYESLVTETETTLRAVCDLIGEPFTPAMMDLGRFARFQTPVGAQEEAPAPLSRAFIGMYRQAQTPFETAFIQYCARRQMQRFQYLPDPTPAASQKPLGSMLAWAVHAASMLGWRAYSLARF